MICCLGQIAVCGYYLVNLFVSAYRLSTINLSFAVSLQRPAVGLQEIPSTCRRWDVNRSTCFMGNLLKSNSLCGYPMMVVYRDEEGEREKESSSEETFRIRLVTVYRLSLPRNQIKFYGIFLNDSPSIGMWSRIE